MFVAPSPSRAVLLAGSSSEVTVRRLHRDTDDGTLSEVTFPAGWSRPAPGSFDVAEEVVWLDGTMSMSGSTFRGGTYSWFPAGHVRADSASVTGARALAWFSGPPGWSAGQPEPTVLAADDGPLELLIGEVELGPGPIPNATGRLLRQGPDGRQTWLLPSVPEGCVTPVPGLFVSVASLSVMAAVAGDRLPEASDPVLCWISSPRPGRT